MNFACRQRRCSLHDMYRIIEIYIIHQKWQSSFPPFDKDQSVSMRLDLAGLHVNVETPVRN